MRQAKMKFTFLICWPSFSSLSNFVDFVRKSNLCFSFLGKIPYKKQVYFIAFQYIPYESPILGQLLNLICPAKIYLFEPRLESYNPYNMAN